MLSALGQRTVVAIFNVFEKVCFGRRFRFASFVYINQTWSIIAASWTSPLPGGPLHVTTSRKRKVIFVINEYRKVCLGRRFSFPTC